MQKLMSYLYLWTASAVVGVLFFVAGQFAGTYFQNKRSDFTYDFLSKLNNTELQTQDSK